jgi:hypothetical protein
MGKPLTVLSLLAIAGAAPSLAGAWPAGQTPQIVLLRHTNVSAPSAAPRLFNYGVLPAVYRSAADPADGTITPRRQRRDAPPRLTLDDRFGDGAVASFGLEHGGGQLFDRHELNSALAAAPALSDALVGAKVSYPF